MMDEPVSDRAWCYQESEDPDEDEDEDDAAEHHLSANPPLIYLRTQQGDRRGAIANFYSSSSRHLGFIIVL